MDKDELQQRISQGDLVHAMTQTVGWKLVEAQMTEWVKTLAVDNGTNAQDWEDYLAKKGMIRGIEHFFTTVNEFESFGTDAAEELEKLID